METYDLIVIGSGPAGEKGAAQAAYFGKRVALVEKEAFHGGAATNTGTIPSKTLRESAVFLSGFRHRELDGLEVGVKKQISVRDFMARERIIIEHERARITANLKRHHISVYSGTASFVDAHTVAVTSTDAPTIQIQAPVILIATGSYPYWPGGYLFDDPLIYDSNEILELEEMPRSLLVVGGGVIGCEYACMFSILGTQVTVIEKRDCLVGFLDLELAASLRAQMEAKGIRVITSDTVTSVQKRDNFHVVLGSGAELEAQTILVSSGRCGNIDGLNLEMIGVQHNERGQIHVDENFRTSVPGIYAAGDVIGSPALASTSMEQARVAMVHAFDLKYKEKVARTLPYGIYTIPECAMVGETEESLIQKQIPYVTGRATYMENARGQIIGDSHGFVKLLFHADDMRLLGAHIIGELATEMIHVALTAMLLNATADLFIRSCYNYPTLTEVYKYAAYDALRCKAGRPCLDATT